MNITINISGDLKRAGYSLRKAFENFGKDIVPGLASGIDERTSVRDVQRREIDRAIAEDARRFPAFATARRAAVMAIFESGPPAADVRASQADTMLVVCHIYERERGGMWEPSQVAKSRHERLIEVYARGIDAYERCRALP